MEKQIFYYQNKIHYRVIGSGTAVLLVHGFGEDGLLWDEMVAALSDKFQFIAPDLPGSGKSDAIEDMTMEGLAEILEAIIQNENINKAVVIGHSMGGYISLAYAEKYIHRIQAFGLFHSTAFADSDEKKAVRQKGIEFIRQHGAFEFIKATTPNLFSQHFKDHAPEVVEKFIGQQHNFKSENLVSYYKAMMNRPDRTSVLKAADFPVLFIMGKYDSAAPLNDMLQQCHLPQKSYIHILQNTSHLGMIEEKEKCVVILDRFLWETSAI
ncbi:MAG: alpha/beta hydrolase [Chitinophagaceae bacterium]